MENLVLELRKNGLKYDEITKKTGYSKSKISKICRKNGIIRFNNSINLSNDTIYNIKEDYDNGDTSLRKLSKKYGYSRHIIRKYVNIKIKKNKTNDEIKYQQKKSVIDWRKRTKIKLVEYKGGKCVICGYKKSIRSLQFHHLNSNEKDFTISGKSYSFDKLKKEVDKCILVCSNCHCEIHDEDVNISMGKYIDNEKNKLDFSEHNIHHRKTKRPSYEKLIKEIDELGYVGAGRKYNVSDNSIRNWKKYYEKYKLK